MYKILIIRLTAIGDIIHVLPSIYLLRKYFPTDYIGWVISRKVSDLLINHPIINKTFIIENDKSFLEEKWDYVIDYHNLLKTIYLRPFLNTIVFTLPSNLSRNLENQIGSSNFFCSRINNFNSDNIVERFLLLTKFCIEKILNKNINDLDNILINIKKDFDFYTNKGQQKEVFDWISYNKLDNFVIIAPNTSKKVKALDNFKWIKIIEFLNLNGFQVIVAGSSFDIMAKDLCNKLKIINKFDYIELPKWSLSKTIHLIKKSLLVISVDSCMLHIASFLSINSIGLFGPSSLTYASHYYNKSTKKYSVQAPCKHDETKMKNHNDKDSMNKIDLNKLYHNIKELLNIKNCINIDKFASIIDETKKNDNLQYIYTNNKFNLNINDNFDDLIKNNCKLIKVLKDDKRSYVGLFNLNNHKVIVKNYKQFRNKYQTKDEFINLCNIHYYNIINVAEPLLCLIKYKYNIINEASIIYKYIPEEECNDNKFKNIANFVINFLEFGFTYSDIKIDHFIWSKNKIYLLDVDHHFKKNKWGNIKKKINLITLIKKIPETKKYIKSLTIFDFFCYYLYTLFPFLFIILVFFIIIKLFII